TTSPSALPSISVSLSHTPPQEPTAAQNLLAANKSLSPGKLRRKSKEALLPEPARFDKFGRRILRAPAPLSRANSSFSTATAASASSVPGSAAGSGAVTPVGGGGVGDEQDIDLTRAKKLLELYEMRSKLLEMGDTGLARSKERVDRVVDQYAKKDLAEREKVARARHLGV
ncbi:hypothetical protein LAWI1_G007490, partial [Lachnellula willkommii]